MYSKLGLIKAAVLLTASAAVSSCGEEPPEPIMDTYVVYNLTSAPYILFGVEGYNLGYVTYMASGDDSVIWTTVGDGGIKDDPGKVCVVIANRDSVIEVVPKLMTEDATKYSIFSGLDDWSENISDTHLDSDYKLSLTDDALAYISNKMRSQGVKPYHIVKDEFVNSSPDNIVVSALSGDSVVYSFSAAAGDTVALPQVGLLFDYDHYMVECDRGTYMVEGGFANSLVGHFSRIGESETGVRQLRLTDTMHDCLLTMRLTSAST